MAVQKILVAFAYIGAHNDNYVNACLVGLISGMFAAGGPPYSLLTCLRLIVLEDRMNVIK